jgi:hypothetical protein
MKQKMLAARRRAALKLSPLRKQSLFLIKKRALRHAASSHSVPSGDCRSKFGFIPKDAVIEVASWPQF